MDYYELRSIVANVIPRTRKLVDEKGKIQPVKEKGRKTQYQEFKLTESKWIPQERLLNLEELNSFVEVSCRAQACPMPLNIDTWDGLLCPFGCKYCYANAFRASLYTAFFDNSKTMGFRHCNATMYKKELDVLMKNRGKDPHSFASGAAVAKAIGLEIPMRFGIRFEDFLDDEKEKGISLELLEYLADISYPVMINTKSALVGRDDYVEALARNAGRAAVHMTLISSDNEFLKELEPGAPSYRRRLRAMEKLVKAGVRVVPRIEPFLVFLNDKKEDVEQYMKDVWEIGCRHITFDTYSYTAKNPGIRQSFHNMGYDWDRLFLLGCDSQAAGSLLLGKFMQMFRERGFSCSTFDMGNAPDNNQMVCCEVGDWFRGGFNYGCTVTAARYIQKRKGKPTSWKNFVNYVNKHGGFLSAALYRDVKALWNTEGNQSAYSHSWSRGMHVAGTDEGSLVWKYKDTDFRERILEDIIKGL